MVALTHAMTRMSTRSGRSTCVRGWVLAKRRGLSAGFWGLWSASAASYVGDGLRAVALPLLTTTITRDPRLVSGMMATQWLPWVIFSLHAGALVDRVNRRLVIRNVQFLRMLLLLILVAALLNHGTPLVLLYLVAFAIGTGEVLADTATEAYLPSLVTRDRLAGANSWLFTAEIMAKRFGGPAIGGLLFSLVAYLPFAIDAISFGAGAAIMQWLRGGQVERQATRPRRPTVHRDIWEGLRWLWKNGPLRAMALALSISNLATSAASSIFVLFALQELHVNSAGYGLLIGGSALGSLLGAAAASQAVRAVGDAPVIIAGLLVPGVAITVLGLTSSPVIALLLQLAIGMFFTVGNVVTRTLRQSLAPDEMRGRVTTSFRFLGYSMIPVGALLGGAVASLYGLRAPFIIAGIVNIIAVLGMMRAVNARKIAAAQAMS